MHLRSLLLLACALPPLRSKAPDLRTRQFVRLQVAGLGRYGAQPAVFLEEERDGMVLPVPVPRESELAFEQALSLTQPSMAEVLLHVRPFAGREGGLLDSLPWAWNASPLAKADCFARLGGRDYPRGERRPASPFHLLCDAVQRSTTAGIANVYLLDDASESPTSRAASVADDTLVVSGCVVLERRLPSAEEGRAMAVGTVELRPRDAASELRGDDVADPADSGAGAVPCRCGVDEAVGVALALGGAVCVEASIWHGAARVRKYAMLRRQLRICIAADVEEEDDEGGGGGGGGGDENPDGAPTARSVADVARARLERAARRRAARVRPPPVAPWEVGSAEELLAMPPEDKALSALSVGLRLPSVRGLLPPRPARDPTDASAVAAVARASARLDAMLVATLERYCEVDVRCELRAKRALDFLVAEAPRARGEGEAFSPANPELFALSTVLETCADLRRQIARAVASEAYARASELQSRLTCEVEYLDELLETMPAQDAFTTSAAEVAAATEEEEARVYAAFYEDAESAAAATAGPTAAAGAAGGAGGGDGDGEGVGDGSGGEWFERIRRVERERRLSLDFATAFIEEFRGKEAMAFPYLMQRLEEEQATYQRKEEALWQANAEGRRERRRLADAAEGAAAAAATNVQGAEGAVGAAPSGIAWRDELAPRVARQLVFALSEDANAQSDGTAGATATATTTATGAGGGGGGGGGGGTTTTTTTITTDTTGRAAAVPSAVPPSRATAAGGGSGGGEVGLVAGDWSVRRGVAQLDALLEAAGRGDREAARTLRRLASLTRQLEELQRRRRSGVDYQRSYQRDGSTSYPQRAATAGAAAPGAELGGGGRAGAPREQGQRLQGQRALEDERRALVREMCALTERQERREGS